MAGVGFRDADIHYINITKFLRDVERVLLVIYITKIEGHQEMIALVIRKSCLDSFFHFKLDDMTGVTVVVR